MKAHILSEINKMCHGYFVKIKWERRKSQNTEKEGRRGSFNIKKVVSKLL